MIGSQRHKPGPYTRSWSGWPQATPTSVDGLYPQIEACFREVVPVRLAYHQPAPLERSVMRRSEP
ncbi:hypothetical protein [Kibdelosporangium philippinense]|uniref:hypothetical protein n=1 Tax=Kibdelosporangium philippinense TaxID=211113 RepID=UPI00360D20D8